IIIKTPQYPNGRRVIVWLGCLIGDLVANHKVAGFASHSATWNLEKFEDDQAENSYNKEEDYCEMKNGNISGQAGLSWEQGHQMIKALSDVIVPFGVTEIPKWLGQAKEGKIKASEWQSLFSIYLPLTVVDTIVGDIEKYRNQPSKAQQICLSVEMFYALVVCTHILEAWSITKEDCKRFGEEYRKYWESSKRLFQGYEINPNHHYALHIEMHLRQWGPLMGVAKFAGERLNGMLQKIHTLGKIGK
ncbi:hypothetical protein O181_096439, partial [Austropuccinia psidii MF-1]|nr:hypothetical protein [Austropuccinia psidii MF-1]